MDVRISGKGIDLGGALQAHVTEKIESGVHKYFDRPAEANVVFTRNGPMLRCETTAHLASGVYLSTEGEAGDAYGAFEDALEKLEKRVRRYKRRLKNHHAHGKQVMQGEDVSSYVLQAAEIDSDSEEEDATHPIIIAENTTTLRHMSVSDAVFQLELTDQPVFVFKNAAHGQTSVVYRRGDGHIGWIDTARA